MIEAPAARAVGRGFGQVMMGRMMMNRARLPARSGLAPVMTDAANGAGAAWTIGAAAIASVTMTMTIAVVSTTVAARTTGAMAAAQLA